MSTFEKWNITSWRCVKNDLVKKPKFNFSILVILFDIVLGSVLIAAHFAYDNLLVNLLSPFAGALVLIHFYLLSHEANHSALFKSKLLNDIWGHILSWALFIPYIQRTRSHLLHHIFTSHPRKDPANDRMIKRFSVFTDQDAFRLNFLWKVWFPMIVVNDRIGLWFRSFNDEKDKLRQQFFASLYIFGYLGFVFTLYSFGSLSLLWGLFIPSFIICLLLEEVANLPHHAESMLLEESSKPFGYWEQFKVSHSCSSVPIWSKYVLLNFNLHAPHHMYPWVPWFRLREIQKYLEYKHSDILEYSNNSNELVWSLKNRRRPLTEIMKVYFDHKNSSNLENIANTFR